MTLADNFWHWLKNLHILYKQIIMSIISPPLAFFNCDLCGKESEYWSVPDKYWRLLPSELHKKYLCVGCFLIKWLEREKMKHE